MMQLLPILLASSALAQTPAPPPPPAARNAMQAATAKQREAAALQREAVRKQAEMAAQWTVAEPPAGDVADTNCDPISESELAPLIETAAKAHAIQPKLLRAVMEQESGFRPCAISPKGAQGLMQLMPDTAGQFGVRDPFDPQQNIAAGAAFLKQLLDKYQGDLSLVLGAYNAGPAAVDQSGGVPGIPETRNYIDAIRRRLADPPSGEGVK
jgi:soluble lytic murein transglycosylase-like protein